MKIGFDIGGVLSKYPDEFRRLMISLSYENHDLYIITDMHPAESVLDVLVKNDFNLISPNDIYSANYEKYGNMAKAILIKELGLDIFIDDFEGYLQWDSSLGSQPILLKVQPDAFKPYWADTWKCDGGEFGRRKYSK